MHIFIIILVWLAIFLLYFLTEFMISFFFTYKISNVAKEKYTAAAFTGATSTFFFMFSTLLAAYLSKGHFVDYYFFSNSLLFIVWTALGLTVGNFTGTVLIPKFNKLINKFKERRIK